jgi:uncharacterized protein YbjT (DUF2867 family)
MHSILVLGASGLIGSHLTQLLLEDNSVDKVYLLLRRSMNFQHSKLEERVIDFSNVEVYRNNFPEVDTIFCCIGTTQKLVKGDIDLYRRIDFDIPVNAARFGLEKGTKKYIIVTAIGANSKSNNFYVKLKGQVEDAIAALPFESVHIMRPSLLLGKRKEFRLAERIFQAIMKPLNFLVPGKYKAIEGSQVAVAMLKADKSTETGIHIYTYKEMATI